MAGGRGPILAGGLLALMLWVGGPVHGQATDSALKDRVAQLVARLEATKAETRDAAEKSLIELGPRVLPLLPEKAKGEVADRLEKVRTALREASEKTNTDATKVTLKGKGIRLTEALQQIQSQTGNPITDLREQLGTETTNPALDLDINGATFFDALEEVAEKAGLAVSAFTNDGSIGLMAGPAAGMPKVEQFIQRKGPFRILIKQIGAVRDFQTGTGTANIQLEVAWEPRLRPMLLAIKSAENELIDDQGRKIEPDVMDMSEDAAIRPENPAIEINLNLKAPDRSAKKIAKLKVKGDLTIPAGLKTFRFPNLAKPDVTIKQGDIAVTLESTEVEEQTWKVTVGVAYPGGGAAFESYRQGLFNNRLWLQKADGSRFEHNGGLSNTGSDGGKLGFEYLFVDAPGKPSDYGFVYETPSKVITIPVEFEFKDVPLP